MVGGLAVEVEIVVVVVDEEGLDGGGGGGKSATHSIHTPLESSIV